VVTMVTRLDLRKAKKALDNRAAEGESYEKIV